MADKVASLVVLDANGYRRTQRIRTSTGAAALISALANSCNAQPWQSWEGPLVSYSPTPGTGPYRSGQVVAEMVFLCADGSEAALALIAPELGLFQADQRTLDSTNPLVVAIITAAVGNLESATGSLATSYLSGVIVGGL